MIRSNVLMLFPEEKNAIEPFDAFWKLYPRRVAKKDADRAWQRLSPADRQTAMATLPQHIRYWQQAGRTPETTPHAATWLNGHRFDDELPQDATAPAVKQAMCAVCRNPLTGGWTGTRKGMVCDSCIES